MLVLQDFEALTPNLLARTVETVEGGGIVVLLLRTMSSLQQLYSMTMVRPFTERGKSLADSALPGRTLALPDRLARLGRPSVQRALHPLPWQLRRLPSP